MTASTHPRCVRPDGHTCQQPSGRRCLEPGCDEPAGTEWGPMWCPEHDADRIDRISGQLERIADAMAERVRRT